MTNICHNVKRTQIREVQCTPNGRQKYPGKRLMFSYLLHMYPQLQLKNHQRLYKVVPRVISRFITTSISSIYEYYIYSAYIYIYIYIQCIYIYLVYIYIQCIYIFSVCIYIVHIYIQCMYIYIVHIYIYLVYIYIVHIQCIYIYTYYMCVSKN